LFAPLFACYLGFSALFFTLFYAKPAENYFLDNKSRYTNKLRTYPFLSILDGILLQSIYSNQAIVSQIMMEKNGDSHLWTLYNHSSRMVFFFIGVSKVIFYLMLYVLFIRTQYLQIKSASIASPLLIEGIIKSELHFSKVFLIFLVLLIWFSFVFYKKISKP